MCSFNRCFDFVFIFVCLSFSLAKNVADLSQFNSDYLNIAILLNNKKKTKTKNKWENKELEENEALKDQ